MLIKEGQMYSFGYAPDQYFDGKSFTNITEMISDSEFNDILRLCGINPYGLSDYERFKAFCGIVPMLSGHPIVAKISSLLNLCFGIGVQCTNHGCDEIWETVASKLFNAPMNGLDCLKMLNRSFNSQLLLDCDQLTNMDGLPKGIEPILYGNSFANTTATDWALWEEEMVRMIDQLFEKGGCCVYFRLANETAYEIPSLYHVEQALKGNSSERNGLLLAQILRQLCLICRQKEMTLYLDIESIGSKRVVQLLEHICKIIGLPHTVIFTRDLPTLDAMISLIPTLPIGLVTVGFLTGNYPSTIELKTAYEATVARYPAGLLNVFCSYDLRYSNYEKKRFFAL